MGFWSVLGGAAIGVGAIAAAPFTGGGSLLAGASLAASLAGAGTVAAAVGAGVAGGTAGYLISESEKDEGRKEGRQRGIRETTAKYVKREKTLIESLRVAHSTLKDDQAYFDWLKALVAVGMATAYADGEVTQDELDEINEFAMGVAHSHLPPHVKAAITRIKNNPPSFNTAMTFVRKLDRVDRSLFEQVIKVVAAADGKETEEERALLAAFRRAA